MVWVSNETAPKRLRISSSTRCSADAGTGEPSLSCRGSRISNRRMFAHVIGPAPGLELDAFAREIRQCRERDQPVAIRPRLARESAEQRRSAAPFVFDVGE